MLADQFPWMPVAHEAEALRIYDAVFGDLPLDDWTPPSFGAVDG